MINPMDLQGKHLLITGASAGIGREASIQASKLGAKVSLVARNEERLNETKAMLEGEGHEAYSFDLNSLEDIEGLVKNITTANGKLDGLVHCAGIGQNRPIKFCKPDHVLEIMQTSFMAFAELVRVASGKKFSNDGASFLGISSIASVRGGKTQGAYAAAKSAMNGIVHPYAKELAPRGIRVNTVAFGMVDTDMYKGFVDSGCDVDDLLREQYLGIIPVQYAGNIICFMMSDVSKYITGSTVHYDAGVLS